MTLPRSLSLSSGVSTPIGPSTGLVLYRSASDEWQEKGRKYLDSLRQQRSQQARLFSLKKPKHLGVGMASGVKNLSKGIALGAAALVFCPVIGAKSDGPKGFFKGVAMGLAGAVTLPVAGVVTAGVQIGRGLMHTPAAVVEGSKGKTWDEETEGWFEKGIYCLNYDNAQNLSRKKIVFVAAELLKDELMSSRDLSTDKSRKINTQVVDTHFYDILGVHQEASEPEIRKAYYKKARDCHPDKNPDDEEANEKFQELSNAYQVLADPARRRKYDQEGRDACEGNDDMVDGQLLMAILSGADALVPYVGGLRLFSLFGGKETDALEDAALLGPLSPKERRLVDKLSLLNEEDGESTLISQLLSDMKKNVNEARQVKLAILLKDRVQRYVDNEDSLQTLRETMTTEAMRLCESGLTAVLLASVGYAYESSVRLYGDKCGIVGTTYAKVGVRMRRQVQYVRTAGRVVGLANSAYSERKKETKARKAYVEAAGTEGDPSKKEHCEDSQAENQRTDTSTTPAKDGYGSTSKKTDSTAPANSANEAAGPKSPADEFDRDSTTYVPKDGASGKPESEQGSPRSDRKGAKQEKRDKKKRTKIEDSELEEKLMNSNDFWGSLISTLIGASVIEIEETVRKASKKMLRDVEAHDGDKARREEALLVISCIFQDVAAEKIKNDQEPVYVDLFQQAFERMVERVSQAEASKEAAESEYGQTVPGQTPSAPPTRA